MQIVFDRQPHEYELMEGNLQLAEPPSKPDIYEALKQGALKQWWWYRQGANKSRNWSRFLLSLALAATALAGIIPVLSKLLEDWRWGNYVDPMLSSVLLGLAALLVGLDRLANNSNNWLNFSEAQLQTERALWSLLLDHAEEISQIDNSLYRKYLDRLFDIRKDETRRWTRQQESAFTSVTQDITETAERARTGSVKVSLADAKKLTEGWEVTLGNSDVPETTFRFERSPGIINDLTPGFYNVQVTACSDGDTFEGAKTVRITESQLAPVEFDLGLQRDDVDNVQENDNKEGGELDVSPSKIESEVKVEPNSEIQAASRESDEIDENSVVLNAPEIDPIEQSADVVGSDAASSSNETLKIRSTRI